MAEADTRAERLFVFGLMAAALVIRLAFWAYTGRLWEDSLITVLHAENLWHGLGLTHLRPDNVPVHGFTSPISVLVPVLGGALDLHGTYAMPFIQGVSAFTAPLTIWLAWLIIRECVQGSSLRIGWLIFSLSYLAIEHHQILWGMAGMETQMVVATVFFAGWACARPTALRLGIALALALYARPDFAFLDMAICAYAFLCVDRTMTLKAIAIGAALYAPWIAFTYLYYGSPIPNTIFAKLYGYGQGRTDWPGEFISLWVPLGPSYAGNGSGYYPIFDGGLISFIVAALFIAGSVFAAIGRVRSLFLPIAFVVIYSVYYVFFVSGVFGWYVVPLSAATVFVAGFGLVRLAALAGPRLGAILGIVAASGYAVAFAAVTPVTMKGERDIQRYVENPVRRAMGEYLGKVMKDGERVGLEPLGYVGYYSRHLVVDYPGLVNPEVVKFNHESGPHGLCGIINKFKPEYIALRLHECRTEPWLTDYRKLGDFQADTRVGKMFMADKNIDLHFTIFQRTDLTPPAIDTLGRPRSPNSYDLQLAKLENVGAALPVFGIDLGYAFSAQGWAPPPPGPGAPPTGPDGWASYAPLGDQGQGKMSAQFTAPAGTESIIIPIVTGPSGANISYRLTDASGAEVANLIGPDATSWQLWRVNLPRTTSDSTFRIEVTDAGAEWGQWAGLGAPHLFRQ